MFDVSWFVLFSDFPFFVFHVFQFSCFADFPIFKFSDFHMFRHFFVTNILMSTGNMEFTRRLARHESDITKRYVQLDQEKLIEVHDEVYGNE